MADKSEKPGYVWEQESVANTKKTDAEIVNNYMVRALDLTDRVLNSGSKDKEEVWKTFQYFFKNLITGLDPVKKASK